MNTHICIKVGCGKQYEDNEVDAYYCKDCKEANKALAAEIDKTITSRPRKPVKSALQEYDETTDKVRGFMRVRL